MESHIEVIGESKYLETVQRYVADINIIVWTNRTKIPLNEITILRNLCIESLLSNGLEEYELTEGGLNIRERSLNRRRIRQEARQKIIISCSDISRLIQAVSTLEKLFKKPRYSFTLDMHQPVFGANWEIKEQAKKTAIQNAYSHAKLLLESVNTDIENVIQIEEMTPIIGESEVYNNKLEDIVVKTVSNGSANYRKLKNAVREITLRYRVSFGIKSFADTVRLNTADFS
ncbi:SIMPL domain-containing protein [Calothrix sp. CCY 0018]|uniref:SIMPL domain-containing protein n=1 Tax=Calothrix sp. CCY 0018 TaxID=3103864 RepID=UPI0039C64AF1